MNQLKDKANLKFKIIGFLHLVNNRKKAGNNRRSAQKNNPKLKQMVMSKIQIMKVPINKKKNNKNKY